MREGFTGRMDAAGLRRAGFVATIATGLAMLAAAVFGMTRVDTTLRLAAAAPATRTTFVVDVHEHRHGPHALGVWRECGGGDPPAPRI
jgi:hypothetical protein